MRTNTFLFRILLLALTFSPIVMAETLADQIEGYYSDSSLGSNPYGTTATSNSFSNEDYPSYPPGYTGVNGYGSYYGSYNGSYNGAAYGQNGAVSAAEYSACIAQVCPSGQTSQCMAICARPGQHHHHHPPMCQPGVAYPATASSSIAQQPPCIPPGVPGGSTTLNGGVSQVYPYASTSSTFTNGTYGQTVDPNSYIYNSTGTSQIANPYVNYATSSYNTNGITNLATGTSGTSTITNLYNGSTGTTTTGGVVTTGSSTSTLTNTF